MNHYIIVFSPKKSTHRFAWRSLLTDKDSIIRIKNHLNKFEIKYGALDLAYHMIKTDNEKISSIRAKSSFFRDVFFLEEDEFKQKIMYDYQFKGIEHLIVKSRNIDKESFTLCTRNIEQLIGDSSIVIEILEKNYCEYIENKKTEFKINIENKSNFDIKTILDKSRSIKNSQMLLSL